MLRVLQNTTRWREPRDQPVRAGLTAPLTMEVPVRAGREGTRSWRRVSRSHRGLCLLRQDSVSRGPAIATATSPAGTCGPLATSHRYQRVDSLDGRVRLPVQKIVAGGVRSATPHVVFRVRSPHSEGRTPPCTRLAERRGRSPVGHVVKTGAEGPHVGRLGLRKDAHEAHPHRCNHSRPCRNPHRLRRR